MVDNNLRPAKGILIALLMAAPFWLMVALGAGYLVHSRGAGPPDVQPAIVASN